MQFLQCPNVITSHSGAHISVNEALTKYGKYFAPCQLIVQNEATRDESRAYALVTKFVD